VFYNKRYYTRPGEKVKPRPGKIFGFPAGGCGSTLKEADLASGNRFFRFPEAVGTVRG
jgi:hypothetical protein